MADKLTVPGHEWQGTCFSQSGRYGNCECGNALYVTYAQHQTHLAQLVAPVPDSPKSDADRLAAVEAQVQKLTDRLDTIEDDRPLETLVCAGCGFVIEDVGFARIGGNIEPYVPAKNYHLGCIPRVPAAPRRRELTVAHLRDWVNSEVFGNDTDARYEYLVARINAFFGGD